MKIDKLKRKCEKSYLKYQHDLIMMELYIQDFFSTSIILTHSEGQGFEVWSKENHGEGNHLETILNEISKLSKTEKLDDSCFVYLK